MQTHSALFQVLTHIGVVSSSGVGRAARATEHLPADARGAPTLTRAARSSNLDAQCMLRSWPLGGSSTLGHLAFRSRPLAVEHRWRKQNKDARAATVGRVVVCLFAPRPPVSSLFWPCGCAAVAVSSHVYERHASGTCASREQHRSGIGAAPDRKSSISRVCPKERSVHPSAHESCMVPLATCRVDLASRRCFVDTRGASAEAGCRSPRPQQRVESGSTSASCRRATGPLGTSRPGRSSLRASYTAASSSRASRSSGACGTS